jgi:hypothetical protein
MYMYVQLYIIENYLHAYQSYHYHALFVCQPTENWKVWGRREFVYMSGVKINFVFITLRSPPYNVKIKDDISYISPWFS